MRIIDQTNDVVETIEIVRAEYLSCYKIQLTFADGSKRVVDFEDFLTKSSHPEISKYLDEAAFRQFKIVSGNLDWNDFDLCFPVADLYDGKLS